MQRLAVFFDRDNTLIVNDGYLGDPSKVVLVDGAAAAVARAQRLGFAVVIVSNQSGVARGLFTEEAVVAVNRRMSELLLAENPKAVIDDFEFCPFHPRATLEKYRKESNLRKPSPGMFLAAAEKLSLDLSHSWLVGDAPRDIQAGAAADCRTILFTDATLSPSHTAHGPAAADYVTASLIEAMDIIEGQTKSCE
jgi:D-glycero-D-manno-heptose 1,7-bisphosphate phosphatase